MLCVFAKLFVKYDQTKRRSAAGGTFDNRTIYDAEIAPKMVFALARRKFFRLTLLFETLTISGGRFKCLAWQKLV
jgi:hypothetical protein